MYGVLCFSSVVAEHCYMLVYRLGNSNQTDQGDETEGFEMEEWRREGGREEILLCLSLT
jgi:hypothetical protein